MYIVCVVCVYSVFIVCVFIIVCLLYIIDGTDGTGLRHQAHYITLLLGLEFHSFARLLSKVNRSHAIPSPYRVQSP